MGNLLPFNVQEYKQVLMRQPGRREDAVRVVMGCSSFQVFKRYYEHTPQLLIGLFKKNSKYLKRKSYSEIYKNGVFGVMKPLDYVGMLSYVLPLFKNEINDFVAIRGKFEDLYLNGEYDEAEKLLDVANNSISYSLWSAINQIKISELKGGIKKRLETFNRFNGMNVQPIFEYFCDYAQETASINTSALLFYEKRQAEIESFHFELKWQTDYLLMNLFPYENIELNECLSYDFKSSLIDLYIGFITYLPQLITMYKNDTQFKEYLSIINHNIQDERLEKFCVLLEIKEGRTGEKKYDKQDKIATVFEECVNAISEGKELGNSEGTLYERIKFHLCCYLGNKDRKVHGNKLAMISLSNIGLHPLRRLCEIMNDLEESNFSTFGSTFWMYADGWRMLDSLFYEDPKKRNLFLNDHSWKIVQPEELPLTLSIDNIMQILISGDRTIYANVLEERLQADSVPEFCKGLILGFLFEYHLKKKNFKHAILLYVNYRLEHPNVIPTIDKEMVNYMMVRSIDTSLDCHRELAVFYRMINGKAAKISANATRYIMEQGLKMPGDMECDGSALSIYFMDKVLDENTLDLIPVFYETSEEVMRDRIKICQKLKAITNDRKYSHEINYLITELGIQGFLQQVESSKIDVDELLLKRYELDNARDFFNVYLKIDPKLQIMADDGILRGLFPKEMNTYESSKDKKNIVPISYKQVLFTTFIQLLREAFLLNDNAGLDYYLSSRVRHGTIKNQLRHHLQQVGLTTRKNATGNYDLNVDWVERKLGLDGESSTKALDIFLRFSQRVDEIILNLKDCKIQVKTEVHNKDIDACFDLSLEYLQNGIYKLYQEDNKVFSTVVDAAFALFWERVENCFVNVKQAIRDAENQLNEELDALNDRIVELAGDNAATLSKFKDTITSCKTHLQQDCKTVSDWFQRSQTLNKPFTMVELANASVRGINQYCNSKINEELNITSNTKISGRTIGHFYAMFHDILNNIVDYYEGKGCQTAPCKVSIWEEYGFLKMLFTNKVQKEDHDYIQGKIDEFEVARTKVLMGHQTRIEGNTGFYKINNVVNYFLLDNGNSYNMKLNDDIFETKITINLNNIKYEENPSH